MNIFLVHLHKLINFLLAKRVSQGRMAADVQKPVENVVREPPVSLTTGHAQTAVINLDTILENTQSVLGVSKRNLVDQVKYN